MLCSFIFLNIAAPIVLAKSASLYYMYWATAIVAFPLNIFYTVSSIRNQFSHGIPTITLCVVHHANHTCDIPSDASVYQGEIHILVTIIPLAVFIELLAYCGTHGLISEARGCFKNKQADSLSTAKGILSLTTFA